MMGVKNKVAMVIFKILAVVLGIATLAFSVWNTWSLLALVMPGDDLRALLGVALFDVGMVVWFGVYVYASEGTAQRSIALIAGVLTMIGTLLANWFYLTLGGQTLVRVDPESGAWAVRTVELAIILHIVAMVGHYLSAPHISVAIKTQEMHDDAVEDALKVAAQRMEQTRADAAHAIGSTIHADVMRSLAAQAGRRDDARMIEGTARELPSYSAAQSQPDKAKHVDVKSRLGILGTVRRWWNGDVKPAVEPHYGILGTLKKLWYGDADAATPAPVAVFPQDAPTMPQVEQETVLEDSPREILRRAYAALRDGKPSEGERLAQILIDDEALGTGMHEAAMELIEKCREQKAFNDGVNDIFRRLGFLKKEDTDAGKP